MAISGQVYSLDGPGQSAPHATRGHCRHRANRLNGGPQAPVAQLDRALPSEGKGHTFESCRVRHSFNLMYQLLISWILGFQKRLGRAGHTLVTTEELFNGYAFAMSTRNSGIRGDANQYLTPVDRTR